MATQTAVARNVFAGYTTGADANTMLSPAGATVVVDWLAQAVLNGYGFQIRAGTIATALTADTAITDTRAEYCVDTATGLTIIPMSNQISIVTGTGTANTLAVKSVATVSTAGTAFTPLPLFSGGPAASTTARVAAHAVTVTAELATTTLRHWEYAQQAIFTTGQIGFQLWEPLRPPRLQSPRCLYVQIAGSSAPTYYAHMDYIELPTTLISG